MVWSRSLNCCRFRAAIQQLRYLQQEACDLSHVQPGNVSPTLDIPSSIPRPKGPYSFNKFNFGSKKKLTIKNDKEINLMRDACKIASEVLQKAGEEVQPGVTTDYIDQIVHRECISHGVYPSPLHYRGFPKSVCTSVNNVACHGIPDDRPLQHGDIINVDVTIYHKGYHGDLSQTYIVGDTDTSGQRLVDVARQCMHSGISVCGPGVPLAAIGAVIEEEANESGFEVIPHFCGHGIGAYFHEAPDIIPYANGEQGDMKEGMTFTIEPILTEGHWDIHILSDGWTAVTKDGSRSAQFEHTILITSNGAETLTTHH